MVNVVRINGKVIYNVDSDMQIEFLPAEAMRIEKFLGHLKKNKRAYLATAYGLAVLLMPGNVFAASTMTGGMNLILLLQKASFWVGMGVTMWGLIEMGLEAPGWRGRILKGVFLYIGVLLVPLIFVELQNSLQVNVWEQLTNQKAGVTP
ncbi:hypothetical protein [Cytobacillus kochii]|uniref:hypothetical protein n=1 Tax=Cytobacillus kochii TaxID=859143 RepID=UPI00402ABF42